MFTSAARRADAEAASAALPAAARGAGAETDLVADCTGAADAGDGSDGVFLFETEEVACSRAVVVAPDASGEREVGEEDDVEEAVGALLVAGRLIVVLPEKAKINMPSRSANVMPRYDARRFIRIRYPKNGILALRESGLCPP